MTIMDSLCKAAFSQLQMQFIFVGLLNFPQNPLFISFNIFNINNSYENKSILGNKISIFKSQYNST